VQFYASYLYKHECREELMRKCEAVVLLPFSQNAEKGKRTGELEDGILGWRAPYFNRTKSPLRYRPGAGGVRRKVNVANATVANGTMDYTNLGKSKINNYLGQNSMVKVSNGIGLGVDIPGTKLGIGILARQSQFIDKNLISHDADQPVFYPKVFVSLYSCPTLPAYDVMGLKGPKLDAKAKMTPTFVGIDVGLGGTLILGIDFIWKVVFSISH
jgi:hypothetical protein